MRIARRLILGWVVFAGCGFTHSQTPNNNSTQPQRLFSIPYGREVGKAFLAVYPGAEDEPYYARGHRELLVAPDGKRIAIIGSRESDTYDEAFDDVGRLVHTIRYTVPSIIPICRYGGAHDAFAVDSLGNMYVLRWTETAIEVWRYAVGVRESAK